MSDLPHTPRGLYFRFVMVAVIPVVFVIALLAGLFALPGLAVGASVGIVYAIFLPNLWPRYVYHRYPNVTVEAAVQLLRSRGYTVLEPVGAPTSE